jgi:hypothetical protein
METLMCFSAPASFSASGIIGVIGGRTIAKSNPGDKYLAIIPILFAVQQCVEGIIWLGFSIPQFEAYRNIATTLFLIFAWAIWPAYLPFAIASVEKDERRASILKSLRIPGVIAGIGAIFPIFLSNPTPQIIDFHIDYTTQNELYNQYVIQSYNAMYLLCTVVPMFISSRKGMTEYGLANIFGLIIAGIFYESSVPSTWCFFSALFSIMIYRIITQGSQSTLQE